MPEISVGAQIFDFVFHPTFSTVYTGLLTGHVKAFAYDEQGNHQPTFSVRPSKSSCRGLSLDGDGSHLYAVGKGKALHTIDTQTEAIESRAGAHELVDYKSRQIPHVVAIATGDDDGTVKLWDPRQRDCVRSYTQHFDYISDFLWLDDKRQLVSTSGDGTLSVMDVRSKKPESVAQSEDQEDELLSIVAIKGGNEKRSLLSFSGSKAVVGTQIGILSIFNRSSGWGDCVDRVPGHPMSVDALCNLPSDLPNVDTTSTILTGSSDGYVRAVQILPTKLIGVVADHGEWPIERISIGGGHGQLSIERTETSVDKANSSKIGNQSDEHQTHREPEYQKKWWVGSVGHEDVLRMTDLEGFFRDNEGSEDNATGALGVDVSGGEDSDIDDADYGAEDVSQEMPNSVIDGAAVKVAIEGESDSGDDSGQDEEPQPGTRKRKAEKGLPLTAVKKKKGKNTVVIERSFFDEL